MYGLVVNKDDSIIPDFPVIDNKITTGITYIAEKGKDSTWNITPSQDQYRDKSEWKIYYKNLEQINRSTRRYCNFGKISPSTPDIMSQKSVNCYQFLGQFSYFGPDDYDSTSRTSIDKKRLKVRVIEATYGGNFFYSENSLPQGNIPLCHGNVTDCISEIINKKYSTERGASFNIDVNILNDPVPGFAKDFVLYYQYSDDINYNVHTVYIKEEAHGKMVNIPVYKK